ncbi:MAG: MFS transporter [Bacillus sp. (in: Bacteria)]|nr:MFS transporter [Bacillus sp. (in: firmicutes)]
MKKILVIVYIIQFFVYVGFGMVIPVLPEVVLDVRGVATHIGGLLAVYSLASFVTAPTWGKLADRFGKKKILLFGLGGFATGFILFGLYLDNLTLMYVSRALSGVFSGALYAAAMSTIADLSDDSNRTKHLGLAGMAIGLGFLVGPASGGLLSVFGYDVPFFIAAAIMIALIPFVFVYMKEIPKQKSVAKANVRWLPGLKLPESVTLRTILIIAFVTAFLLAGLEGVFQVYGIDVFAMTPQQMGMLFLVSGVALAFVQGGVMRMVKTGHEFRWMIGAQILSASAFILMALHFNLFLAGVYLVLFTVGNTVIRTLTLSLMTRASGARTGYASGLQYSADSIGRITGPLLFALLYDWQQEGLFIMAGTAGLFFVLFIYINRNKMYELVQWNK